MGLVLIILAAIVILASVLGVSVTMNPYSMVVAIVAVAVFSGVAREVLKSKRDHGRIDQVELAEIKHRISKIEADIADIKEQIADFLIKQV